MHRSRQGPRRGNRSGLAIVGAEALLRILSRGLDVLRLNCGRRRVLFRRVLPLFRRRLMLDAARTTRICDPAVIHNGRIVNHRRVDVGVVNYGRVHAHDSRVIGEMTAPPFSAGKARSHKSKAVVHAAVVSDVKSPITAVKEVMPTFPTPVRRRPKKAWLRCWHPGARNPIVADLCILISPIAGRPHVPIGRARRLNIDGQHRRCNADADKHSGE